MRSFRRLLRVVFTLAAVGYVAYLGYGRFFGGMPGGGMPPGSAPPVTVAEVIVRSVQPWQEFSGRLVAVDSAEIRPQVSGIIQKVHFKEGELVEKDRPLFTIDQRPYAAAVAAAEAQLALAQAEFDRAKSLLDQQVIPRREYDQKQNNLEVAKANLTRAKIDLDYTAVKSPITGRVGRAEITVGNLVKADSAPLLTVVVADKPIYADFDIDEQTYLQYMRDVGADAAKVQGIPVFLGLANEEGAASEGRLQSFDNQLNVRSGTVRARAIFENNDGKLIPGLYARIRLGGVAKKESILITDRAVGTDQNKKFVIVVGDDGKTERREVKLGAVAEGLRMVESGLRPSEKIIVSGMQRVMMPGQPVTVEVGSMEEKSPEPKTPSPESQQ